MHLQINKKIFIYLFIFLILGTYNNKEYSNFSIPKINSYKITGLNEFENIQINKDLLSLQNQTLFFLKKNEILKIIKSHKMIEGFSVFKNYPSSLSIEIEKTNFLAITKKNGQDYYLGSNGNMIKVKNNKIDLPFLFGEINIKEFLKLKKIIDDTNFNYKDIKNLYYFKSTRWDIETKNNLIIKLPLKKLDISFEILLKILEKEELKDFKIIDLRQDNQVILNG
jgi:cell division protein FtsQ